MSDEINVCFLYNTISPRVVSYLRTALEGYPNMRFVFPKDASESELLEKAKIAHVFVGWECPRAVLEAAEKLRLFITPYTGTTHLVRQIRSMKAPASFPVVNAHGASPLIAQHAVSLLFAALNHIVVHHNEMMQGKWVPGGEGVSEPHPTLPIGGRKIGFLGYGQINQKVHQMLSGFDVTFHALKRGWSQKADSFPTPLRKYTPSELETFMKDIDTLIVAAPLTEETNNLIRLSHLQNLGKQGVVVNVGRGNIINEEDLFTALSQNLIARAAIDVWYVYFPTPDGHGRRFPYTQRFNELSNVVLSPHRADSPFDDLRRWDDIIENLKKVAESRTDFVNQVDLSAGY